MDRVTWTQAETERFFSLRENPFISSCKIALLTGQRAGEAYALSWNNVDFEENFIRVVAHYCHKTRKILPSSKTGLTRYIPLSSQAKTYLLSIFTDSSSFVLPRQKVFDNGQQSNEIRRYCRRAKVPELRFHDLRALYASKLLLSGIPMVSVMQILGWTQLSTAQRYLRLSGKEVLGLTSSIIFPIVVEPASLAPQASLDENEARQSLKLPPGEHQISPLP